MQLPVSSPAPASTRLRAQKAMDFFRLPETRDPSNTRNNIKCQIKNKKTLKFQFGELVIPTSTKISSYHFLLALLEETNYEQLSQNN